MPDLTEVLRSFDATETNLKKLEAVWSEIKTLIPDGLMLDTISPEAVRHSDLCRTFSNICRAMPKINGYELSDSLLDLREVFQFRLDAKEIGEIEAEVSVEEQIYSQGDHLKEYRFRFESQRRLLVRNAIKQAVTRIDDLLSQLTLAVGANPRESITDPRWEQLKANISEIDVLRGSTVNQPKLWSDLRRHLHFGLGCDLADIVAQDWPAAKIDLERVMYGEDDPIPVEAPDLGELVSVAPSGRVISSLKWTAIDDSQFERLVFNLISETPSYLNVQWLTETRAADRGRDLSALRTISDPLGGSRNERVIVQCKHWQTRSVDVGEIAKLLQQMLLWEPPKVDELIIATTGRFTSDAVSLVESHNEARKLPRLTMWANSHLEHLLAQRPHLVAPFSLR